MSHTGARKTVGLRGNGRALSWAWSCQSRRQRRNGRWGAPRTGFSPGDGSVGDALPAYVAGITACQNARGCAPEGLTTSALPTVCEVCQAAARTRYSQRCRLTPQATDPQLQCVLSSVRGPRGPREVLPAKYGPSPCGQNLQMSQEEGLSRVAAVRTCRPRSLRDAGSAHASRQHRRRCATQCSRRRHRRQRAEVPLRSTVYRRACPAP